MYRCYDRYGLGFFSRAFFECEPGTTFSDSLDQCVFESVNDRCNPEGGGGGIIVTPPPYVTQPSPVCTDAFSGCSLEKICPISSSGATMYVTSVEICQVAESRCSDGGISPLCAAGGLYDKTRGRCIQSKYNSSKKSSRIFSVNAGGASN